MSDSPQKRTRAHTTRWSVRAGDVVSRWLITVGGIGTIVAVSAVFLFLVTVTIPLFLPGDAEEVSSTALEDRHDARLLRLAVDEYRTMAWSLFADGRLELFRLDTGEPLRTTQYFASDSLTAWSTHRVDGEVAFGFADGSIRLGKIGFKASFVGADALSPAVRDMPIGATATWQEGIVQRVSETQYRSQRLEATLEAPLPDLAAAPIVLIDHVADDGSYIVASLDADGILSRRSVNVTENFMTGEFSYETDGGEVQTAFGGAQRPDWLANAESGNSVLLVWEHGRAVNYDTRDVDDITSTGEQHFLDDGTITTFARLIGGVTFLIGDSEGDVTAAFEYRNPDTPEAFTLARDHRMTGDGVAVTAIGPSARDRSFAVGYEDGAVRVFQATSDVKIADFDVAVPARIDAVEITPKSDGIVVLTERGLYHFDIDMRYPEATLASMFRPVWYEGYAEPAHVWQSSSGTDDFEPKLGMWPLVFGTLKATVYSMLFGIPLALLAAIFTSEFLSPSIRPRIKTVIESMASLPSVVLGFLAGLVFAPFVQRVVPGTLVGFVVVPAVFMLGAFIWQTLPAHFVLRYARFRLPIILALLPLGILLSGVLGPGIEKMLFAGDMILWLDGTHGSGFGGWMLLLFPLCGFVVLALMGRYVNPKFRDYASKTPRRQVALMDLARFVGIGLATIVLTALGAALLSAFGLDPRGGSSPLGTYVQRNAMIVGFVMGFAVIPIIYTIAEDALSAVPDHLRAASLGAGATPWQTAIRIVLPTAMSGLFSAIMIGLGRAVGETMIVLMAAGNTPVLEMNIFNGFRTLSANIAVELPEAVRDSTHYRTLFLAALLLFTMTFIINGVAEIVRMRFRKRSAQI